jgi:hypothetical protein
VGYLLLFLFGVSVGLFCWLTYASLTCAARKVKCPADDRLFERAASDMTGPIGAGSA